MIANDIHVLHLIVRLTLLCLSILCKNIQSFSYIYIFVLLTRLNYIHNKGIATKESYKKQYVVVRNTIPIILS